MSNDKTVLIVDDAKVVRMVSRRILEPLGFTVSEAEDGQKALDFVTSNPMPKLILLDWNMPVMDGITFLRELRKLPTGANPVVVFCTTHNELPNIQMAMESGANEYIMKPFDDVILKEKLSFLGLIEA
ncbi:response regulator [bacterium]|nr:response regulator [bacterium]